MTKVLEHGFIELTGSMGSDFHIYRNARISTGAVKDDIKDQQRLIDFLVKNGHTSPLEFVEFEFHMRCPIYVARQHFRHRLQSANEYSLRYRKIIPEWESVEDLDDLTPEEKSRYNDLCSQSLNFYNTTLDRIKAKYPESENLSKRSRVREKLRGVMGTAFYTEFYWKMNLHAFANWIEKRTGPGAQPEIKVYADAAWELVRPICPIACSSIEKHWLNKNDL